MRNTLVLGIDPGLANCGVCIVDLNPFGGERLLWMDVLHTEKSGERHAHEDVFIRAQLLTKNLDAIVRKWRPRVMALERLSPPRQASSAVKLGMAVAVCAAVATKRGMRVAQAGPMDIKLAVCGAKTADKKEVINAIELRFPGDEWEWPRRAVLWDHAADSVGAVVACLGHPELVALREGR
jgi:Holliday junction resolvasome RuvABC endonuclease subunit